MTRKKKQCPRQREVVLARITRYVVSNRCKFANAKGGLLQSLTKFNVVLYPLKKYRFQI